MPTGKNPGREGVRTRSDTYSKGSDPLAGSGPHHAGVPCPAKTGMSVGPSAGAGVGGAKTLDKTRMPDPTGGLNLGAPKSNPNKG